ncbi:Spb1 C-terminal domain-containing protein [Paraphysoderma sedebokerense]|nr:Spb1 C-terminal domain-containing protein [Paraphysoderma sedebokerense]
MGKKGKTGKNRLDKYYHLAKEQGYRARSAFKLIQLNKKYNFLSSSKCTIDLCAAPGGWLQVASKYMPTNSLIIGVDLVPIKAVPRCITLVEDITTEKCRSSLRGEMKTWKADVVLHDGAPNVGTAWVQDAYTQSELVLSSLRLAVEFLMKGGTFVTKVFRSKDYNSLIWVFNQLFKNVEATKPPSSRNVSAEIFVVCKGFKAPDKIDPKFLDPRFVFKELEESVVTSTITSIFAPEKKKRQRDGYADGDYTLFRTISSHEFINSEDPVKDLGIVNAITFKSDDDKQIENHIATDEEIKRCCEDLKVLNKKDFRSLLKWRTTIREFMGLETKSSSSSASGIDQTTEAQADSDSDPEKSLESELSALSKLESAKAKREKRKLREKRAKEMIRMQLNMTVPSDIGLEQQGGQDTLFSATTIDTNASKEVRKGDMNIVVDGGDLFDVDEDDVKGGKKEKEKVKISGKAAVFFDNSLFKGVFQDSAVESADRNDGLCESDDNDSDDDECIVLESKKRKRPNNMASERDDDEKEVLSGSEFESEDEEFDDDAESEFYQIKPKKSPKSTSTSADSIDQVEGDDDISDTSSIRSYGMESSSSDSESENDDVDDKPLSTPEAVTLAQKLVRNRHSVIDDSFNRYAFPDSDELPSWFLDDERKHSKPNLPVTKEAVKIIREKQKELDARPIKKIAEAKARKKMKAFKRAEKIAKQATTISEADDMSEAAKAQSIAKLMTKKSVKKKDKPTLVVAKGGNRGLKGRPKGVKGRYKMVDGRMKKELRAMAKVKSKKGNGNKRRKMK